MIENLTQEQITKKAEDITRLVVEQLPKFINDTGCTIRQIEIETTEVPLGQTGLAQIKQTVKTHFAIPENHPAFQEVK